MKISIEIDCRGAAFEDDPLEVKRILDTCYSKIQAQLERPDSICDTPEASDTLMDINGNSCGTVRISSSVEMCEWCDEPVNNGETHGEGACWCVCGLCGKPIPIQKT